MDEPSILPALNATLNFVAGCLLVTGLLFVRGGKKKAHAVCMIAATIVSSAFLVSYLTYHFVVVPEVGHTKFLRAGWLAWGYYGMLLSHVLLAVVNLPMVLVTLWRASKRDWERHRKVARWTFPVWLYVSVTGVLVYFALYHWNAPPPA